MANGKKPGLEIKSGIVVEFALIIIHLYYYNNKRININNKNDINKILNMKTS